jgi:hypothetical protein
METKLDLGGAIDKLYALRTERLEIEKSVKALKSEELAMRGNILQMLESAGLDGAKGKAATAAVIYEVVPQVVDWGAFNEYVKENAAFDLYQRRVSVLAMRERWSCDVAVPGVEKFDSVDLSLTRRSK